MMCKTSFRPAARGTAGLVAATILASSGSAFALQGGEDPALLPVLIDKRFGKDGVHQLSLQFSTALATKFVEATGGFLTYGYNFSDLLGFELGGAFFSGKETNIMTEVRNQFAGVEPPLSDLYQPVWMAQASLMIVPLYGKMSFASEIDPSYDLFFVLGAGVAGLRRLDRTTGSDVFINSTQPAFNGGLGLRFYFSRLLALRLEFRTYIHPDPENDPTPEDPGSAADPLTYGLHFQGGLQFSFGGE